MLVAETSLQRKSMPSFKEMNELEKQAHLLERLEGAYDTFEQEYDVSRITVLGAIFALVLRIITHWQASDIIETPEEDD